MLRVALRSGGSVELRTDGPITSLSRDERAWLKRLIASLVAYADAPQYPRSGAEPPIE